MFNGYCVSKSGELSTEERLIINGKHIRKKYDNYILNSFLQIFLNLHILHDFNHIALRDLIKEYEEINEF